MKTAIYNSLKNGYYNGKRFTAEDMMRKCYILQYIIQSRITPTEDDHKVTMILAKLTK